VVYYNPHTRLAAIRCAREVCKMVETSLVFVTDLHNQDISIRVARVCGTSSLSEALASEALFAV
jgi:RNase P/RNase MRP subunit POP5